jgi:Flp pilus assembly protein TadG
MEYGIIVFIFFVVIFGTISSRLYHIKKNTKDAADTLAKIHDQLAENAKALQWLVNDRAGR